ncbi:hypothetical protein SAY87_005378 [Trapa incisa]|uniref:Proline-rich family protein n=1 Tax=Trapa incisa TaxID=236973 RepID=A0AAN7K4M8_9MYRT|nr:hypothetical protein SAY87_005378 [Trapa incisa]
MPPSPASRRSPGRDTRMENHKPGRSLEGSLLVQEKDDDLALFNEMQARERENFLLHSSDDFEDAFSSKLRHFADYKIGISIPARGESSDILHADGEKNDYEWLMTPPDTPLFPSLDDEPAPANIPARGRKLSQPINISRSSTMERSHRSSRGSASPSRSSPSPRCSNSVGQSRGKPSSAPHTSPISSLQNATPYRRISPPPSKQSASVRRSSSPTPRRMSTGSSASAGTSGVRAMSPQKVTRGSSASPKIKAWQANIPGFSCDVPPNLRTSLADRPASYVRGSSPASINGRDSSLKISRQSMSPTATRSVSSTYSHERDWLSPHSKGSLASSGDDDIDSLPPVTVGSLDQCTPRKVSTYSNNNKSLVHTRRSPKMSTSAPKRSFDSVLRQMDNRKAPQNMFRPLLSSVPSTTFYSGNASSSHAITLKNSSITTSSKMSSDRRASVSLVTEYNLYGKDDIVDESEKLLCPDIQEEIFAFDKEDEELGSGLPGDIHRSHWTKDSSGNCDNIEVSSGHISTQVHLSEVDDLGSTVLCSLCGCNYNATDLEEMEMKLCKECRLKENFPSVTFESVDTDRPHLVSISTLEKSENLDSLMIVVSGSPQVAESDELRCIVTHLGDDSPSSSHVGVPEGNAFKRAEENLSERRGPVDGGGCSQEQEHLSCHPNGEITAEGSGISLLLKRSNSNKGLIVQSRALASTILPYEDMSYAKETTISMRSSIGYGSLSSSSSIDLNSSKQTDSWMQRQFSGRKFDTDNRCEVKSQGVGPSLSRTSSYSHQAIGPVTTTSEINFEGSVGDMNKNLSAETAGASLCEELYVDVMETDLPYSSSIHSAVPQEDNLDHCESGRKTDASALQLSRDVADDGQGGDSVACHDDIQETLNLENCEDSHGNIRNQTNPKASSATENVISDTCMSVSNEMPASTNGSFASKLEIKASDCHHCEAGSEVVDTHPNLNSPINEFQEPLKKDSNGSDPISSYPVVDILEESTVTVESHGRSRMRSLTLEEATDTILFCSSIVHDLAYGSASIAMEKEQEALEALEGFRPTVTLVGKSISSDTNDPRSGRIISKRGLKPHNRAPKQKPTDTYKRPPSCEPENDENIDESLTRNMGLPHKFDSAKPPKLESKCNCTIM